MSAHEEEVTGEIAADAVEGIEEGSMRLPPSLVDERIKANLELLHAQISALTEVMDRLVQSNSAREITTASSQETRLQIESPLSGALRSSKFPTVASLTNAGYLPDILPPVTS